MITAPNDINRYQQIVIKSALKLNINTGMLANREYTPTKMLAMISKWTGKNYKVSPAGKAAALADITKLLEV